MDLAHTCLRYGAALTTALSGCTAPSDLPPAASAVRFVEVTETAGIDFIHTSGRSGRKYGVETIGSGAAFLDFDGDGWVDLYVVNGTDLPGYSSPVPPRNALYHNQGDATFDEVAVQLGVADTSYGMGCTAGDYDNDGDTDLFVANFGPNLLYRNGGARADWRFADITDRTILGADDSWSTGCAFVDYDLDGDLDLYVANYLDYRFEEEEVGEDGRLKRPRRHLAPTEYPGRRDYLYRNEGGNRFVDITATAGLLSVACRELGAVFFDFDEDGDPDLFQGNDATPNFLYRNEGDGSFAEVGLVAGVAFNEAGKPEGTMGVDVGDVDGDGHQDLVMTNFQWESNTLYRNLGNGLFRDESQSRGIGTGSFARLAFGVNLFDADNDGDLDLYVANGHIDADIADFDPQATYAQRDHFYLNDGQGRFAEVTERAGPGLALEMVGRGSAVADYDNDGDMDLFIVHTQQRAVLLRNDTPPTNHYLALWLRGTQSNRDGLGARVAVRVGDQVLRAHARSASSYLSQSDPRLFFGLGRHTRAEGIEIIWPSGVRQELGPVRADQILQVVEPVSSQMVAMPSIKPSASALQEADGRSGELERFWRNAPLMLPPAVRAPVPLADPGEVERLKAQVQAHPERAAAHFALAEALRQQRQYEAAISHYQRVLDLDPGYAAAYTGLGQVYSAQGAFAAAVPAFQEAARLDPDAAEPHYYLGNLAVRQSRSEAAVQHYERALKRNPAYLQAYVNLAGLHARQTDYRPAIAVFKRGLQALPAHPELLLRLGRIYFIQTRYREALAQLQEMVRQDPGRSQAYELMAQAHLQLDDPVAAVAALNAGLERDSTSAALRARLGILLLEEERADEAIGHLDLALHQDPDRAEAYYNLGQASLRLGAGERGRELLRYFQLLQENHQDLLAYKTAIVLNPNDARAYYNLGSVYSRIGRYEAARQAYAACLQIHPQHVEALNNLGNISLRRHQVEAAIATYLRVLDQDSTYARVYNNLGNAYLLADRRAEAVRAFERAVQLEPDYPSPRSALARLYRQQGRRDEAQAQQAAYQRLTQATP